MGWTNEKKKKKQRKESNGLTRNSLSSAVEKERQVHHLTAKQEKEYNVPLDVEKSMFST